ncbi:MFS transporter [Marasmius fiardii PR-910]|nr:MFS transporter [Marasmius fiardii PR-910]
MSINCTTRLVRRLDVHIVPSSMLIYLFCFLDRANIGNAKILNSDTNSSLQQTTHISNNDFNTALMIFLVGCIAFEVPSNFMLKKFRPSRWLAFLLFGWGSMTLCMGAVRNSAQLIALRFLLGGFEGGLFPGLVYFLTFWYRPEERALRVALILACATLAGAFGGAVAFAIGQVNGLQGLEAWRWLFFIEGIPSCVLAVLVFFLFPDYPETATWLTKAEKNLAVKRLSGVASLGHDKLTWKEAKKTLLDWRLYVYYMVYICISVPFSSISIFMPTIISGVGYRGLDAQLFTVPPYALAFVVTVTVSWLSDKYEARSWGCILSLFIAGVCFIVEGTLQPTAFRARYGVLCVAVSFAFASMPPSLSWLTANLRTTTSTTLSVPINVSFGGVGQIIGIYIYKASESPGYPTGHYTIAGVTLFGSALALWLRIFYLKQNKRLGQSDRKWRL